MDSVIRWIALYNLGQGAKSNHWGTRLASCLSWFNPCLYKPQPSHHSSGRMRVGKDVTQKPKSLEIAVFFVSGPPEPPNDVQAFPTCDRIDVTWRASRKDGGSAVTGYMIRLQRGEETIQSESLSASKRTTSLRSLEKGTEYAVRISSMNTLGEGEWRVVFVNTTVTCKESYAR